MPILRCISIVMFFFSFMIKGNAQTVDTYAQTDSMQQMDSLLMLKAFKPVEILYDANVVCRGDSIRLEIDYTKAGSVLNPVIQWSTGEVNVESITVYPVDSLKIWVSLSDQTLFIGGDTLSVYATEPPILTSVHDTICMGNEATVGVIGGMYYEWNTSGTTQYINVRPLVDTFYKVKVSNYPLLEKGYKNRCFTEDSVFVTVLNEPTFTIVGDTLVCRGNACILRIDDVTDILWSTGEQAWVVSIPVLEDSIVVKATATDRYGCRGEKTHTVKATGPQGEIIASTDTLCFGDELILTVVSPSAERVRWYNGFTEKEIRLRPKNTLIGYVEVFMAEALGGCSTKIYDTIYVKECSNIIIPNAFKLDGFTKELKPIGIYESYKTYYFAIFTRNGKMIFESHDFTKGWDGKYKGEWVIPAVYVYYYSESVNNHKLEERGTITVVR